MLAIATHTGCPVVVDNYFLLIIVYGHCLCTSRMISISYYNKLHQFLHMLFLDIPVVANHPTGDDVLAGKSITLMCRASGTRTLEYSWEQNIDGNWTTVSNDNTTSYTTDTSLAIGQYMYRCRVSNEAGSIVSNIATVNVYGEYCPNM